MSETVRLSGQIPESAAGERVDKALAALFPDYSRARLTEWLRAGQVRVDRASPRPRDKVRGGEWVEVEAAVEAETAWQAQALPLEVVHEDESILVVNKPPGLVVHPAAGNPDRTLVNALLHHAPELSAIPRAGVVHRLDKETSGLLVVARTLAAQAALVRQLQERTVKREYDAVVAGVLTGGGSVDAPIGRHPVQRKRMAVVETGKPAVSHYRVLERFAAHTLIRVALETGRTHQIRVHMAHIRHPIVGDPVYGGRLRLPGGCSEALREALRGFRRQALHAGRLGLVHPATGEPMEWRVKPPADMAALVAALREHAEGAEPEED